MSVDTMLNQSEAEREFREYRHNEALRLVLQKVEIENAKKLEDCLNAWAAMKNQI